MPEIEESLCRPEHSSLLAPAGYGKTEEIVRAVSISEGKQLILTHTNAGVASLKSRLRKFKVPNSKFSIDTIASWLLKYSAAYPKISGLTEVHPEQNEWQQVYTASMNLFHCKFIREIIQSTYSGVFIDEYQDCTLVQHNLVVRLADMLPVRILGDPLQGIFGFRDDDPLINWDSDVLPIFKPLPELQIPWRWINGNKELGNWLIKLRKSLLDDERMDLSTVSEIEWYEWSIEKEIDIGSKTLKNKGLLLEFKCGQRMPTHRQKD
jgi:DNA helicase-2/ATP-dependent DNA helicase PcrA